MQALQVPLLNGLETLHEYEQWQQQTAESARLPAHVRKGYDKAQDMVRLRQASEAAVADDKPVDTDLLAAYMAYIRVEEVSAASFVQCCSNCGQVCIAGMHAKVQTCRLWLACSHTPDILQVNMQARLCCRGVGNYLSL